MDIKCDKVFDISERKIPYDEPYYLDTNIWYWLTYPRVTFRNDVQLKKATDYTSFISSLQTKDVELCSTIFTYSELINIVERNEFNLVKRQYHSKKHFRKDLTKRKDTLEIIANVLEQVDEFSTPDKVVQILDYIKAETLIQGLNSTLLDGNDLIVGMLTKENEIVNIISDDSDFGTLGGINLFTLNAEVIKAAREQGRLA